MGQYHKFMNFDKKQVIEPTSFRKLMEWNYQTNEYLLSVERLLKTSWKGDNVLVVGDYVDDFYNDEQSKELFQKIIKENKEYNSYNIYDYPYKEINVSEINNLPTRYIYNHNKKQYVDLKKQPIQWIYYNEETNCIFGTKIHPLGLLLSCSNGAGGGDYFALNYEYVGNWINDSKCLELSDTLLNKNYKEFKIKFDENKSKKSNNAKLIEYLSKNIDEENLKNITFSSSLFLTDSEKKYIIDKSIIKKNKQKIKENITDKDLTDEMF